MTHRLIIFSLIAAVCSYVAATRAFGFENPFEAADFAPADVDVYVCVDNAKQLRATIGETELRRWIDSNVMQMPTLLGWRDVARAMDMSEAALFDACFGSRATYLRREISDEQIEWAIVTEVEPHIQRRMVSKLGPILHGSQSGWAQYSLPEQAVRMASRDNLLIIGGLERHQLMTDLIDQDAMQRNGTLAAAATLVREPWIDQGQVGILVRHATSRDEESGWTATSAAIQSQHIDVRHAARFNDRRFSGQQSTRGLNAELVHSFAREVALTIAEPSDTAWADVEPFILSTLGTGVIGQSMRPKLGDHVVLLVAEPNANESALAVMIENTCSDCDESLRLLDEHVLDVAGRLDRLSLPVPADLDRMRRAGHGEFSRRLNMTATTRSLLPTAAAPERLDLHWNAASGPAGSFWLMSTNAGLLRQLERNIATVRSSPGECDARIVQCGAIDPARLSHLVRGLPLNALITGDSSVHDDIARSIKNMCGLAQAIQSVRWTMQCPTANDQRISVLVTLKPRGSEAWPIAGAAASDEQSRFATMKSKP